MALTHAASGLTTRAGAKRIFGYDSVVNVVCVLDPARAVALLAPVESLFLYKTSVLE